MTPLATLVHHLRGVQARPDPHAELLALVWGPRFDRQHADALVQQAPAPAAFPLWRALQDAAERFDSLPGERQQRLRRLIVQDRARLEGRWENASHAPHPAD